VPQSHKRVRSAWFAVAGDLALDLFAKFQRMMDFLEDFRSAPGAADDHRAIAEDSAQSGLVNDDALDAREDDFEGAALGKARFYDDALVGDGHLGGVALEQANAKNSSADQEAEERAEIDRGARRQIFGGCAGRKQSDEKREGEQLQNRRSYDMPEHHDPVQFGLILDGLAGDEMLFDVAQGGSLKELYDPTNFPIFWRDFAERY